jgi:DNA segregation ATPase FtsK/SpoIIIE, S-DNA-T family
MATAKTKAKPRPKSSPKRKAPARNAAKPRKRPQKKAPRPLQLPQLSQRQRDLSGLALVATALFIAFPLYSGGNAGIGGEQFVSALRWSFGQVAYLVPPILALAGLVLILRPVVSLPQTLRIGALCLLLGASLALAAGTLGLGTGTGRTVQFDPALFGDRGGAVGDLLYLGSGTLVGPVGSHIFALFLLLAAVLLISGLSIAAVLRLGGSGLSDIGKALASGVDALSKRRPAVAPIAPPEPDGLEPTVQQLPAVEFFDLSSDETEPYLEEASDLPESLTPPAPAAPAAAKAGKSAAKAVKKEPGAPTVFSLPNPNLLKLSAKKSAAPDKTDQSRVSSALLEALRHHGIEASLVGTVAGPHITRYELRLAPGVKMNKIGALKDDLAYALAATDIRILAPIPGKQAVGVEVPNRTRLEVTLGDVFQELPADASPLTVFLGKDVGGRPVTADLARMPHLLIAGTTGAGKSGAVNAMLSSILLRATPDQVRLVLVDPKQVELNHYEAIPHLLTPVITSPRMAANALGNLVREMEWRYGIMAVARTRSLAELNKHRVDEGDEPLPYLLCVIDELADLMMVAPADVENAVIRLAQKARAVGIHLVLATQSPRVDVITGMIKANVPSRIAFAVSSQTDSRVILDQNGAESLLGQGDMLFSPVGSSKLERIQGAYIDEPQIAKLTEFWAAQGEPVLREDLLDEVEAASESGGSGVDADGFDPDEDPMLSEAIALVVEMDTASTSMLQRRLRVGYTRAGRLIDMLERRSIISGYEGSKPRQVLVTAADLPRVLAALESPGAPVDQPPEAEDATLHAVSPDIPED